MSGRPLPCCTTGADQGRKPLLHGRGALLIEDFCRTSGLDQITVDEPVRSGRLEGALMSAKGSTRVVGSFDDVLPSREALAAMGLPVRDDYKPDALRTHELIEEDPDAAQHHGDVTANAATADPDSGDGGPHEPARAP